VRDGEIKGEFMVTGKVVGKEEAFFENFQKGLSACLNTTDENRKEAVDNYIENYDLAGNFKDLSSIEQLMLSAELIKIFGQTLNPGIAGLNAKGVYDGLKKLLLNKFTEQEIFVNFQNNNIFTAYNAQFGSQDTKTLEKRKSELKSLFENIDALIKSAFEGLEIPIKEIDQLHLSQKIEEQTNRLLSANNNANIRSFLGSNAKNLLTEYSKISFAKNGYTFYTEKERAIYDILSDPNFKKIDKDIGKKLYAELVAAYNASKQPIEQARLGGALNFSTIVASNRGFQGIGPAGMGSKREEFVEQVLEFNKKSHFAGIDNFKEITKALAKVCGIINETNAEFDLKKFTQIGLRATDKLLETVRDNLRNNNPTEAQELIDKFDRGISLLNAMPNEQREKFLTTAYGLISPVLNLTELTARKFARDNLYINKKPGLYLPLNIAAELDKTLTAMSKTNKRNELAEHLAKAVELFSKLGQYNPNIPAYEIARYQNDFLRELENLIRTSRPNLSSTELEFIKNFGVNHEINDLAVITFTHTQRNKTEVLIDLLTESQMQQYNALYQKLNKEIDLTDPTLSANIQKIRSNKSLRDKFTSALPASDNLVEKASKMDYVLNRIKRPQLHDLCLNLISKNSHPKIEKIDSKVCRRVNSLYNMLSHHNNKDIERISANFHHLISFEPSRESLSDRPTMVSYISNVIDRPELTKLATSLLRAGKTQLNEKDGKKINALIARLPLSEEKCQSFKIAGNFTRMLAIRKSIETGSQEAIDYVKAIIEDPARSEQVFLILEKINHYVPINQFLDLSNQLKSFTLEQLKSFNNNFLSDGILTTAMLPKSSNITKDQAMLEYLNHLIRHPGIHKGVFEVMNAQLKVTDEIHGMDRSDKLQKFSDCLELLFVQCTSRESREAMEKHPEIVSDIAKLIPTQPAGFDSFKVIGEVIKVHKITGPLSDELKQNIAKSLKLAEKTQGFIFKKTVYDLRLLEPQVLKVHEKMKEQPIFANLKADDQKELACQCSELISKHYNNNPDTVLNYVSNIESVKELKELIKAPNKLAGELKTLTYHPQEARPKPDVTATTPDKTVAAPSLLSTHQKRLADERENLQKNGARSL
jgi:hypothetical protein